jgi:hypothetical protein
LTTKNKRVLVIGWLQAERYAIAFILTLEAGGSEKDDAFTMLVISRVLVVIIRKESDLSTGDTTPSVTESDERSQSK